MKYDGIILDVDGTIWNTTGIVASAWNEAIKESGYAVKKVNSKILKNEFGKTMNIIAEDIFPEIKGIERENLLNICCEKEKKAVKENTRNITYKGVQETIKKIATKIPVFIVSNCQKGYIELVLEKNDITQSVKDFECYGNTGNGKSENIMAIILRNGLKHPAYVGDTQGDCDACKKAGIPFIWASYGFGKVNSYTEKINNFSELENIL